MCNQTATQQQQSSSSSFSCPSLQATRRIPQQRTHIYHHAHASYVRTLVAQQHPSTPWARADAARRLQTPPPAQSMDSLFGGSLQAASATLQGSRAKCQQGRLPLPGPTTARPGNTTRCGRRGVLATGAVDVHIVDVHGRCA